MQSTGTPLPTGTVTFLFTDVVGNVPIWERDPVAMKAALARHHAILYEAAHDHQGVVFKILGDEFQIAFEFPENAIEAALQAYGEFQRSHGPARDAPPTGIPPTDGRDCRRFPPVPHSG